MNPVLHAQPGPSIYKQLHDERQFSEHLTGVLERMSLDRVALKREMDALREQLRLADEIAEGLRVELEMLRDFCAKHGLNAEQVLED